MVERITTPGRVRRRVIWGCVLLVLGVGTTFAVAWLPAFVLFPNGYMAHDDWYGGVTKDDPRGELRMVRSTLALSDWVQLLPPLEYATHMDVVRLPSWAAKPAPGVEFIRIDTGATGWPMRAFASESWHLPGGEQLRHNLRLTTRGSNRVFLPLRPIWPGLFMDSAIFAAGWAGLLLGPPALRRYRRRRRGWCVGCGYDLRDSTAAPCPECGWNRGK